MLSLWYIILGWKEYNKPFIKQERPGAWRVDPPKNSDLISQRGSGTDVQKVDPPKPVLPSAPKFPDSSKSSLPKDIPKVPEAQKLPDLPKGPPKIPERPKIPDPVKSSPPKLSDVVKGTPKTPDSVKVPEIPKPPSKIPDLPKPGSKGPDAPKVTSNSPDSPKVPELPKRPKVPERTDVSGSTIPSRKPDSATPYPAAVPKQEFPLPPYLPGVPNNPKSSTKGDELFDIGSNRREQAANGARKPMGDLRDLSYGRGELVADALESAGKKVRENLPQVPKYMNDSAVSNPDSLDSSGGEEEDEEEEDDD